MDKAMRVIMAKCILAGDSTREITSSLKISKMKVKSVQDILKVRGYVKALPKPVRSQSK